MAARNTYKMIVSYLRMCIIETVKITAIKISILKNQKCKQTVVIKTTKDCITEGSS